MSDWNTIFSKIKNSEARQNPTLKWETIENKLDKNNASKNRNRKILLSIMAAASVVVVAVFLVFDLNNEIPDVANDELNQELEFITPQRNTSAKPDNALDLPKSTRQEVRQNLTETDEKGKADNLRKKKSLVKSVSPAPKTIPLSVYEIQSIHIERSQNRTNKKLKEAQKEVPQPAAMLEDIEIEEVVGLPEKNDYADKISFEEQKDTLVKKENSLSETIQKNNNGTLTVFNEKDVYTVAKLSNKKIRLTSEHEDFPRRIKINTSEKKISFHGNKNSIYAQRLESIILLNKAEFIKIVMD